MSYNHPLPKNRNAITDMDALIQNELGIPQFWNEYDKVKDPHRIELLCKVCNRGRPNARIKMKYLGFKDGYEIWFCPKCLRVVKYNDPKGKHVVN